MVLFVPSTLHPIIFPKTDNWIAKESNCNPSSGPSDTVRGKMEALGAYFPIIPSINFSTASAPIQMQDSVGRIDHKTSIQCSNTNMQTTNIDTGLFLW